MNPCLDYISKFANILETERWFHGIWLRPNPAMVSSPDLTVGSLQPERRQTPAFNQKLRCWALEMIPWRVVEHGWTLDLFIPCHLDRKSADTFGDSSTRCNIASSMMQPGAAKARTTSAAIPRSNRASHRTRAARAESLSAADVTTERKQQRSAERCCQKSERR